MNSKESGMEQLTDLQLRIVRFSMKEFATYGIKPVKMDNIAKSLGISKRTLYEAFGDKEKLLLLCVKMRDWQMWQYLHEFRTKSSNTLEIILAFFIYHLQELQNTNYRFLEELKKYPSIVTYISENHDRHHTAAAEFLNRGQEQGMFRSDLNMKLVSHLIDTLGDTVKKEDLGSQYPIDEIFKTMMLIFIRGIATPKGLDVINQTLADFEIKIKQPIL